MPLCSRHRAIRAVCGPAGGWAAVSLLLLTGLSCGPKAGDRERAPALGGKGATKPKPKSQAGAGLAAERVASVPAGTFGPYLARRGDVRLLAWAALDKGVRTWRSVVLDPKGKPVGAPRVLGKAPENVGLVSLEATSKGFVLVASSATQPVKLEAFSLDSQGKKIAGPQTLAEEPGELLWVDWVNTAKGPLALWALRKESAKSDRADVYARGLRSASVQRVVDQVRAWQTAPFGDGAALAVVRATGTELGPVDVLRLDADGRTKTTVHVTTSASAEPDVDMVPLGDGLVLAWTDRSGLETRVVSGAINANGKLAAPPKPLAEPRGDQALIRLVPPQEPGERVAFAVWEDAIDQLPDTRRLRVARIGPDARASKERALLDFGSVEGGVPELAVSTKGLTALTLARPCERGANCDAPPVATLVELDQRLSPVLATPLELAPLGGKPAPLAWGLTCGPSRCLVLSATDGAPAQVYAVRPDGAESRWKPAAEREATTAPPALASLSSMARLDAPLSAVATTEQGDKSIVAWVSFFDPTAPWKRLKKPAKDGRFDPPRALLATGRIGSTTRHTVSFRARSTGGVAIASDQGAHGESLLVWTALDAKVPQVFATVVDADGKKLRQRMVTRSKGEKADLSVARVGDGWIATWVDERSGTAEVYAAKINRFLQRAGPERRLGPAGGVPSALTSVAHGGDVLVAWVAAPPAGQASVRVQRLSARDASTKGEAKPIRGAVAPLSPVLARTKKGTVLGWLEPKSAGHASARLELLAADGLTSATGQDWPLETDAVGMDIRCKDGTCRLVAVGAEGARGALYVSSWRVGAGAPTPAKRIAAQTGAAVRSTRPRIAGSGLVVADQSKGRGVVRYAQVKWK